MMRRCSIESLRRLILLSLVLLLCACGGRGSDGVGSEDVAAAEDTSADAPLDTSADAPPVDIPIPPISEDITPESLVLDPGSGAAAPELPDGIRVRAGSYNVYGLQYADAATIGALLATLDLDMVGLQECPGGAVAEIAAAGGFQDWHGQGTVLLSRTPLVDAAAVSLKAGRSFVHATTEIEGVTFSFYSTHLGWNVEGDLQCREFVDEHLSLDPNPHLILVGDFNDEHLSTQNTILEEVVSDAATAMGWYPGQRISWPSTGFDDTEGSQLIDLVFFRKDLPAIVVDAQVVNLAPVFSDHKPVFADLLFPADPGKPFAVDPLAPLRDPLAALPSADALPENLLRNPGAEDGLEHWQTEGNPAAVVERSQQTARTGERFFTGFAKSPGDGGLLSAGSQDVDLHDWSEAIDAQEAELYVSAHTAIGYPVEESAGIVANMPKPYDDVEIITTLLDETGAVLERISSGRRDALGWFPYGASIPLPPGVRTARLTWLVHHRGVLEGNDGAIDDLYLGIGLRQEPHKRVGANLLENAGGEDDAMTSWEGDGWVHARDLDFMGPWGIMFFPPSTRSGRGMFTLGAWPAGRDPAGTGTWGISQSVDLSAWRDRIDASSGSGLALRWGGWLRTTHALGEVRLSLDILDRDSAVWGTIEAEPVPWAEWTLVEGLVRMPRGAAAVRLRIDGDLPDETEGLFADALFLIPEVSPAEDR